MKRCAGTLALGLMLAGVGGCGGCGANYSEGDRTGVITKFSKKGLSVKSWEGEMNLGGLRTVHDDKGNASAVANVWAFHASDDMAPKIQEAMKKGAPVTLHYHQWFMGPSSQDSDYDVTEVTPAAGP